MTEINDLIDEGNDLDANGKPEKARSERYSTVDIFVSLLEGAAAENRKGIAITLLMCLACFLPPNDSSFASSSERAIVRI
jgi:hypothetical protein